MSDLVLSLTVNGTTRRLAAPPRTVLADLLRDEFGLTGCKVACDQGVCGACTVLMDGVPVAACSTFAFQTEGAALITIEGLARHGRLHAVQRAFLQEGAFQCGFCTAGMILSIVALLGRMPSPDEETIRDWLGSHVCRCTGYRAIIAAVRAAARELSGAAA